MENKWVVTGQNFFLTETSNEAPLLEKGVYNVVRDMRTMQLYLEKTAESFEFSHKVYGVQDKLIERIHRQWYNSTGNLGCLFNGIKGTGKTVTTKQVSNKMELPTLLVNEYFPDLPMFINKIQQDVVILIDEYEKIYTKDNASVLTVMDGILNNGSRRLFMLTTNNETINDNLLQRPGRIRYRKLYKDLTKDVIEEIVDDVLLKERLQFRDELVEFISCLKIITIDIVIALCKEVNIHNESPKHFAEVFNVQKKNDIYDIVELVDGKDVLIFADTTPSMNTFRESHVGLIVSVPGDNFKVKAVKDWDTVIVEHEISVLDLDPVARPHEQAWFDRLTELDSESEMYKKYGDHACITVDRTFKFNAKNNYHSSYVVL